MIRTEIRTTIPTDHGELYDVPVAVDFDPETGIAAIVSARIRALTIAEADLDQMCDLRWVRANVQDDIADRAAQIIADDAEYHRALLAAE